MEHRLVLAVRIFFPIAKLLESEDFITSHVRVEAPLLLWILLQGHLALRDASRSVTIKLLHDHVFVLDRRSAADSQRVMDDWLIHENRPPEADD